MSYEGPNIAVVAHDEEGKIGVDRRFGYDDIDHPLWMYDREEQGILWYELDTIGNVRRLRGGPVVAGFLHHPTDLGGYKYTAFGKLLPPDTGTPAPKWHPNDQQGLDQPLRWQARWYLNAAGGIYEFRNRWWSPEIAAFLSIDDFGYFNPVGTLWSRPEQNPFRVADPTGHGIWSSDPRAPLVAILVTVGLADAAAVILEHQSALDAISKGDVAGAVCSANKILDASAALAAGAVTTAIVGAVVGRGGGGAAGDATRAARITAGSLPAAEEASLLRTLGHIDAGTTPTGPLARKWGTPFRNWAGDLPGARGPSSPYLEYRVALPPGTSGAGPLRVVSNPQTGEIFYTWTHYGDTGTPAFVQIR